VAGREIEALLRESKFEHVATVEAKGRTTAEDEVKIREGVRELVKRLRR
jgi:flavorubredoxin